MTIWRSGPWYLFFSISAIQDMRFRVQACACSLFFLLVYFILQVGTSYHCTIVKVTNNHVCVYLAQLWNLGQPCCCTGHKYCKMVRNIYIIQFCMLHSFQTTPDTIKLLELPTF